VNEAREIFKLYLLATIQYIGIFVVTSSMLLDKMWPTHFTMIGGTIFLVAFIIKRKNQLSKMDRKKRKLLLSSNSLSTIITIGVVLVGFFVGILYGGLTEDFESMVIMMFCTISALMVVFMATHTYNLHKKIT